MDFNNATEFLINLDYKELLRHGSSYLKEVRMEEMTDNLYAYPDPGAKTVYTRYDLFDNDNHRESMISGGLGESLLLQDHFGGGSQMRQPRPYNKRESAQFVKVPQDELGKPGSFDMSRPVSTQVSGSGLR